MNAENGDPCSDPADDKMSVSSSTAQNLDKFKLLGNMRKDIGETNERLKNKAAASVTAKSDENKNDETDVKEKKIIQADNDMIEENEDEEDGDEKVDEKV